MDLRELTKLVLKLAGLYVLVNGLVALISAVADPEAKIPAWFLGTNALYLILGAALFWFPGVVINRVIHLRGIEGPATPSRLLEVGLALLGVFFALEAMYGGLYTIARVKWFYPSTFPGTPAPPFTPQDRAALLASIVQVGVGIALYVFRRKVAAFEIGARDDR